MGNANKGVEGRTVDTLKVCECAVLVKVLRGSSCETDGARLVATDGEMCTNRC